MMTALRALLLMTLLTGVAYPLLITGVAQLGFPDQANGSIRANQSTAIGSELIAQKFEQPSHFWPRPSAVDFNPSASGASNLGPTSSDLKNKVDERRRLGLTGDLLWTSASGLDPHITPESARSQVHRISETTHLGSTQLEALIDQMTEPRQFGILGEPRVNVLLLNLALDRSLGATP